MIRALRAEQSDETVDPSKEKPPCVRVLPWIVPASVAALGAVASAALMQPGWLAKPV
jgi:hypothetical protein